MPYDSCWVGLAEGLMFEEFSSFLSSSCSTVGWFHDAPISSKYHNRGHTRRFYGILAEVLANDVDRSVFETPLSVVELREFWAEFRSKLIRLYLKHVPVVKDIDLLNNDYYFKRDLSIFVDIYKASKRLPHLNIWSTMSPVELITETLEDPLTPPPKHPEHRKSVMALQEVSSGSLNQRQDGFTRPRTPKKSVKRQSSIQSISRSSTASAASTNRPLTPQKSKRRESVQSLRYSTSLSGHSMTSNNSSRHSRSTGSGSIYRHRESLAVSSMKDLENSLSSADREVPSSIYSFISSDPPTISPASPAPVPPPKSSRRPLPSPPPLLEDDEKYTETPPLDITRCNSPLDRKPEELWSTPEYSYESTSQTESPDLGSPKIESLKIKKSLRSQPKYVHRFMSTPDLRAKVARTKATVKEVMIMEPGTSSKPILKPPSPQKKAQMSPSTIGFAPENEVFRFDKNNVVGKSLVGWSTTKMAKPAKISSKMKLKRLFSFSGGPNNNNNNNNALSAPPILKNHNSIESFSPSLQHTLHTNQSPTSNPATINAVI
ncbi:hypothetical protein TRICI_005040 [Trichomonascus ciferrii]|uniref:Uncharacterized protein n=1 Tax=Trichomonascus ciferrii TaxID=44093 RepID=A0A642V1B8_9ASCO|nr:hypothetical protein TRICI_005040 [Trichomonascus ciferrii]